MLALGQFGILSVSAADVAIKDNPFSYLRLTFIEDETSIQYKQEFKPGEVTDGSKLEFFLEFSTDTVN